MRLQIYLVGGDILFADDSLEVRPCRLQITGRCVVFQVLGLVYRYGGVGGERGGCLRAGVVASTDGDEDNCNGKEKSQSAPTHPSTTKIDTRDGGSAGIVGLSYGLAVPRLCCRDQSGLSAPRTGPALLFLSASAPECCRTAGP